MDKRKITVIGCGLIGGSICMALKRRRPQAIITALDRPERLPAILDAGVADQVDAAERAAEHVRESGLVVLSTPVEAIVEQVERIAPHLEKGAVVTDTGSTKATIMERARDMMPEGMHFVGGHPMAGAERSGVETADPLLFKDRVYLLCPQPSTPQEALLVVMDMVDDLLAVPLTIEPEEHDRVMAMVSHVPQVAAMALVHAALQDDLTHGLLDSIAGRGFLDLTRVAAAEFAVWKGILETNRTAIFAALDRLQASLDSVRAAIAGGGLADIWEPVSRRRRKLGQDSLPRMRKPDLRALIDRCDEQLLKAVGNRLRLAAKIGKLKKDQGAPVHDPDRERRLLRQRCEWAESLDLPTNLVQELFSVIIDYSRRAQVQTPQ